MDRLYILDCTPLMQEEWLAKALPHLDADRQGRIKRIRDPRAKAQCAAVGWLLTHLFGNNGTPPRLRYGNRGKPYLQDCDDLFFSVSHSDKWVVCATANVELGADAQVLGPYRDRVAERCFTDAERRCISRTAEDFAALWTAKEAYLKYTGFGLVLPMQSFTVPFPATGWDEANRCHWWNTQIENLHITVCVEQEWKAELQIIDIEKSL